MKIKQVIESLKVNTDNILTDLSKDDFKKIIDYLSNKYFNENISLISDQLFDYIKEYYEDKFKTKVLDVGSTIKNSIKTKLPFYMGSLNKIKPTTGTFNKWVDEYTGPYVLSYKLDGISALLYKHDGIMHM